MLKKKPIQVNHDTVADVLYIVFGENRPSYAEDIGEGVYVRYDMKTNELVGITILDFTKRAKGEVFKIIQAENIVPKEDQESLHFLH